MTERTTIGTILGSANSVEILIHIHENPGCRMSDIYQKITRNAHTREKIQTLADFWTSHPQVAGIPYCSHSPIGAKGWSDCS